MSPIDDVPDAQAPLREGEVLAHSDNLGFRTTLDIAGHPFVVDEPIAVGGTNQGPSPYGLISAALASCTAMTLHSYSKRKGLPLRDIRVAVRHSKVHEIDCEHCADDAGAKVDQLERTIWIEGDLTDAVRERLMQIADNCPVHRSLRGGMRIVTKAG